VHSDPLGILVYQFSAYKRNVFMCKTAGGDLLHLNTVFTLLLKRSSSNELRECLYKMAVVNKLPVKIQVLWVVMLCLRVSVVWYVSV